MLERTPMSRLHKPKAGWAIRFFVILIYPAVELLFRVRSRNLTRIPPPEAGPAIIAVNHISIVDPLVMARTIWQSGRLPRFLIKSGVFDVRLFGRIVAAAGQIPVYRGTTEAADSLREAARALDRGEAVVIYPEGTITKDPAQWPMEGRTGIARLVLLRPDVPVIPIGQWGAQHRKTLPWYRKLGRREARISVGAPLDLSKYRDREATAETLREITDLIMDAVRTQVAEVRGGTPPVRFHRPERRTVDRRRAG
jgi:1-acyl-sn-glycerol-3-phosphate acyltransferase